jgi:hypothetical protein
MSKKKTKVKPKIPFEDSLSGLLLNMLWHMRYQAYAMSQDEYDDLCKWANRIGDRK